jgi:hypothetical protein
MTRLTLLALILLAACTAPEPTPTPEIICVPHSWARVLETTGLYLTPTHTARIGTIDAGIDVLFRSGYDAVAGMREIALATEPLAWSWWGWIDVDVLPPDCRVKPPRYP